MICILSHILTGFCNSGMHSMINQCHMLKPVSNRFNLTISNSPHIMFHRQRRFPTKDHNSR